MLQSMESQRVTSLKQTPYLTPQRIRHDLATKQQQQQNQHVCQLGPERERERGGTQHWQEPPIPDQTLFHTTPPESKGTGAGASLTLADRQGWTLSMSERQAAAEIPGVHTPAGGLFGSSCN